MTTLARPAPTAARGPDLAMVDVVIPVHNEERDLERCVRRLHRHLSAEFPYPFRITIADNASTDRTPEVARALAVELAGVRLRRLVDKGRGLALRTAWSESDAPVLAYMDVDLSTDLAALLPLVAPLISGHSDLAIGSRLARGSRVVRGLKREALSRGYNLLLRGTLAARFTDAQCGFKAIRKEVADSLLPLVRDTGWFFDTEMLVLAQRAGLRIHEVPVDWVDDPDSRVEIGPTILADLRGIARLGRALVGGTLPLTDVRHRLARRPLPAGGVVPVGLGGQLARFAAVGVVSTAVYLLLFALLRTGVDAQVANGVALLATAVANTAANRRLTFGIVGRRHAGRHHAQGLFVFGLGLALTSGCLALLAAVTSTPARGVELAVVTGANLAATVLRFVLLRLWFHHRRPQWTPRTASTKVLATSWKMSPQDGPEATTSVKLSRTGLDVP
jgi:putative flippase GtrA